MKRLACLILALLAAPALAQVGVDPSLPPYKAVSGVSGSLKSIGSDSLNNLMTLWSEGFRAQYPSVKIEIEGKGSSTAPPALIAGTAQFGPMSRPMKGAEIDAFEKKFGYKPTAFRVRRRRARRVRPQGQPDRVPDASSRSTRSSRRRARAGSRRTSAPGARSA